MIIDYRNGSSLARYFDVVDAATGRSIGKEQPYVYADDRLGLLRAYRQVPPIKPDGPYQFYTGPEGEMVLEEFRRAIRIVVADRVTDARERAFAEHVLEVYKDFVSAVWPDERLNEVEGLMVGVVEDAIGRADLGMEAIEEVRAFFLHFRKMRERLDAAEMAAKEEAVVRRLTRRAVEAESAERFRIESTRMQEGRLHALWRRAIGAGRPSPEPTTTPATGVRS